MTTAVSTDASDLKVFRGKKNPFRSPGSLRKALKVVTAPPVGIPSSAKPSTGSDKPSGGSDKPSGGTGSPTGTPAPPAPTPTEPKSKTTRYTYVVDATFGRNGHLRRYRGLRRLSMLPDEEAPMLISLGVDTKADNAVFIVDGSLKAEGEGDCPPSRPVHPAVTGRRLGGVLHPLGRRVYMLRIDAIRKVTLARAARASRARARRAKRSARTSGAGLLVPPVLIDLEIVATSADRGSRPASHRR